MTNIDNLQFPALKVTGANYIEWTTDIKVHFVSLTLSDTIIDNNETTPQEKAKAIIFLRKHIDENLRHDYAQLEDPKELWKALKDRFDNQRDITLPIAYDEFKNLRFQDFDKVEHYNSAMLRIAQQLRYCGKPLSEDDMLDKTYQTFHKDQYILQQQYRNCGYKRFSELIVALMIAEKNNELLIKNHNARPTGTKAFPEVNAMDTKNRKSESQTHRGHGRRNNRGQRKGYSPEGRKPNKWTRLESTSKGKRSQKDKPQKEKPQKWEDACFKCGAKGHWSRTCRTPAHLCELYSKYGKGKGKEVNLMEHSEDMEYLEASDFVGEFDETEIARN